LVRVAGRPAGVWRIRLTAEELLKAGQLDQCLQALQDRVRKEPAAARHRIFLFQLQAVLGQWQKALNQLSVLGEMTAETLPMVETYREALRCELLRTEIFAGKRSPLVFGQPEPWMARLLQALTLSATGQQEEAQALRAEALEAAPATQGTLDGQRFEWLADADTRLGPMLEVIASGRYSWLPFQRLRHIRFDPPTDLRDLVWTPAHLTLANGGELTALCPTRYPGSEAHPDAQIRLCRRTEWQEPVAGASFGLGQRMLCTDEGDHALLDVREVHLQPSTAASDTTSGGSAESRA
jgi:type VI secretion system protein ImpE